MRSRLFKIYKKGKAPRPRALFSQQKKGKSEEKKNHPPTHSSLSLPPLSLSHDARPARHPPLSLFCVSDAARVQHDPHARPQRGRGQGLPELGPHRARRPVRARDPPPHHPEAGPLLQGFGLVHVGQALAQVEVGFGGGGDAVDADEGGVVVLGALAAVGRGGGEKGGEGGEGGSARGGGGRTGRGGGGGWGNRGAATPRCRPRPGTGRRSNRPARHRAGSAGRSASLCGRRAGTPGGAARAARRPGAARRGGSGALASGRAATFLASAPLSHTHAPLPAFQLTGGTPGRSPGRGGCVTGGGRGGRASVHARAGVEAARRSSP